MANKSPKGYIKVKAEYELVYADKEPRASVLTNTLEAPLQEVRRFNEGNEWEDGWRNMLIFGDNLLALKTLYEDIKQGGGNKYGLRNKIKLIYIDPPFATKQDFMKDKEKAYADKVKGAKFIEFLRKRLIFLKEILADDGSIYVHLDQKKGHYIKTVLDEVFGEPNFMTEVCWVRSFNAGSSKAIAKRFPSNYDSIFIYTKSDNYIFNRQYNAYSKGALRRYDQVDEEGNIFKWNPLKTVSKTKLEKLLKEGKAAIFPNSKYPVYKHYLDPNKGAPVDNVWRIQGLGTSSPERVDYPTQKRELLLERIIKTSSNEGDIVLDCFSGSGTTLTAAEKLKRKWIGVDCGKLSIYTIQNRILNLSTEIANDPDKRNSIERIEESEEILKSKGLFLINEKGKKLDFQLTDDFLFKLHDFLKNFEDMDEFSLVCPEEKFHLSKYEEDEDGIKTFKKDHITYKISFIEPKAKTPKSEPLKSRSFVLYNAGVYDKQNILSLHWDQYKEFVAKLFEVRKSEHSIKGFKVDGYIGVHSAYIWNYPDKKNVAIDEGYVKDLHSYLKGKGGERFYVIAPAQSINFMQDEIKLGETVYTFLKVPASVLIRLIQRGELSSFKQPKSEDNVNEVIDAFGFDFISQPQLKYTLHKQKKKAGLFSEDKYIIKLTEFYSDGLLYSPEDFKNFQTLSLVLIDFDYEEEPFTLDMHYWGSKLVKDENTPVEVVFDAEKWSKNKIAVIFIDEYGNEKKLVLNKKDFK